MYNKFAHKTIRKKVTLYVRSDLLYNENNLIGRLYRYFYIYYCYGVSGLHPFIVQTFFGRDYEKIPACILLRMSCAKADYSGFMNTTADMAVNLIPEKLQSQPVFLCIDDTMVSKFGKKFEDVSKLFDHAAHHGSNYLNGHCFVSVMVCVPVWNKGRIHYLCVPLGYRMWQKKESKLELAASMIRHVMPVFHEKKNVIIL